MTPIEDEASRQSRSSSIVPPDAEDRETQPACEPASTKVPQPAAKTANIEVNRPTAEATSAPVTEATPASTEVTEPVPNTANTKMDPPTPVAASTEVNCPSAGAASSQPSLDAIPPVITGPANPTTSTCQATEGIKDKENIAPIATPIEKEVSLQAGVGATLSVPLGSSQNPSFNFQSTTDAMPSNGPFTSLLEGLNWDASIDYSSLGNGTWDESQALFNFDFMSEEMGEMKNIREQTMGPDLRLPDNMLLNQPTYPLLGPSQLNLDMFCNTAGAASMPLLGNVGIIPNTAHGFSAQDFAAITGNPLTNSAPGNQPSALGVSIAMQPVIQQASNSEKGDSLTPSQQALPNSSPPLLTSPDDTPLLPTSGDAATANKEHPISEQDSQQIIQQGRS